MSRQVISLDQGWKFHLGDIVSIRNRWAWGKSGSWNQGPESRDFDDSAWRAVSLPHDFVIETAPYEYSKKEFDEKNTIPEMEDVGNIHTTAGSFQKEIGWYRKRFYLPREVEGKKVYLIFEGIYRDSRIFLNEFFIGGERSGYTQIKIDISDFAEYGGENILSVKCDAREAEGWFYEGGGIYRHAYLLVVEQDHLEEPFVTSEVDLESRSAKVKFQMNWVHRALCEYAQKPNCTLKLEITDPTGCIAAAQQKALEASDLAPNIPSLPVSEPLNIDIQLDAIQLWDVEDPALYSLKASLCVDQILADEITVRFGLRTIAFDAEQGFLLNGRGMKIQGVCCHQNHGGVGTAIPDELYRYRLQKLKEMGANGYRTSHYPPSPVLLDLCDELGILVMDETRLLSSEKGDLHQLETLVKRDRNHPSVILYSIGNEEAQSQAIPQGARIARTQMAVIRSLDPTRPITMGLLMLNLRTGERIKDPHWLDGIGNQLDVAGFNYNMDMWEPYRKTHPGQPIISTEQGTFRSTRGCYETDNEACYRSMLDRKDGQYLIGLQRWHGIRNPWMSGQFLWTGFDYYGEPTPFKWPAISSQFGIMDLCGFPKDFYYYYKAWWNEEKPLIHICNHWNPLTRPERDLLIFSNCEEVELFVNGESLGRRVMEQDSAVCYETVHYVPGAVHALGYRGGTVVCEEKIETTGETAEIRAVLEYTENDLYVYRIEARDSQGRLVPEASVYLDFSVDQGRILGTCNGNSTDHELPGGSRRKLFHGLAQVLVKAPRQPNLTWKEIG